VFSIAPRVASAHRAAQSQRFSLVRRPHDCLHLRGQFDRSAKTLCSDALEAGLQAHPPATGPVVSHPFPSVAAAAHRTALAAATVGDAVNTGIEVRSLKCASQAFVLVIGWGSYQLK
jgi:hypothetical protein